MRPALLLFFLSCFSGVAAAATYPLADDNDNVVGEIRYLSASHDDTLVDIARDHDIGYDALRAANPQVDAWLPGAGTQILLPSEYILPVAPHQGIVIDLPAMRLFYYPAGGKTVETFPIGIGREGWNTPIGTTKIAARIRNPSWTPPASIRVEHAENGDPLPAVVPAGPDNPLGQYALRLAWPGYLIHGTNKPYGVGMRVSHGCIRLLPRDIETLFEQVTPGTSVHVVNQPWLWGQRDGSYYLQVFPPLQDKQGGADQEGAFRHWLQGQVPDGISISWEKALLVFHQADGVPTLIAIRDQYTPADRESR
ncbi:L,D-transpeptidase family protein [Acidithiobacillus sp. IBUN Pt1247-S3]|uniref:L,D-transpeptidase family protein n=1 Tax=Acidithiobacillus sp. IBUN Pt1247-S3 TaxID=3166642 RepID=UPI0034E3AB4E